MFALILYKAVYLKCFTIVVAEFLVRSDAEITATS